MKPYLGIRITPSPISKKHGQALGTSLLHLAVGEVGFAVMIRLNNTILSGYWS